MTSFRSNGSFWVIGYLSWLTMSRVSVVKSRVINRCKHFDEVHCPFQENEVFCKNVHFSELRVFVMNLNNASQFVFLFADHTDTHPYDLYLLILIPVQFAILILS